MRGVDFRSESDVFKGQILTSKDSPRTERVNPLEVMFRRYNPQWIRLSHLKPNMKYTKYIIADAMWISLSIPSSILQLKLHFQNLIITQHLKG